jgi:hypothetical protein
MCFALCRALQPFSYYRQNQGGKRKSGTKFGLIGCVRAFFGGVSYEIHWRLYFAYFFAHDLYSFNHFEPLLSTSYA